MDYKRTLVTLALLTFWVIACGSRIDFGADDPPKGWFRRGNDPKNYEMSIDRAVKHSGKASAHIKFIGSRADGFGTLMQVFKADDYHGKRVRLSAWMKTRDAESANLWLRVDGPKATLGFDNMQDRAVNGTSRWKKYGITLDVPKNAVNIAFGAFLAGKGQLWVDDYLCGVVGKEVPSTNMMGSEQTGVVRPPREYPKQPVNLDFEGR